MAAMNQQPSYWFPTMKGSEIKAILDEWGFSVTEQQIKQPTGEVVQYLYSTFLQQLTGVTEEILEKPAAQALTVTDEYPMQQDLYATGLRLNLLHFHVHRLMLAARIQDFSMRDLIFPKPDRTRSMLSALINFVKFALQQESDPRKFREKSVAALAERDRLALEVGELRRKIKEIQAQRAQDEPICKKLKEENAQITQSLISTKGQQEALVRDVDALREERSALKREKENRLNEIQQVERTILSAKSCIGIKKQISEMAVLAQEARVIVSSNESKSQELKTKLDALTVFEKAMEDRVDILRKIAEEHPKLEESISKTATFRNELERRKIHHEQLIGRADRSRRQLDKAEDKLNRMRRLATEQQRKAEEDIKRLTKEYAEMSEERRDNDRQVEELKQEADEIERKMAEHLRKNEAELNDLLAEYWALRHQTEVYMETLTETLGMESVTS